MNTEVSITLPAAAIQSAPAAVRTWLMSVFNLPSRTPVELGSQDEEEERENGEKAVRLGVAHLSDAQARVFLQGVRSPKTRQALRVMCEIGPRFRYLDFLEKMGLTEDNWDDFQGVWSGLTRRTRTVTEDDSAYLVDWLNFEEHAEPNFDPNLAMGEMDPGTVAAFRRAFGI